MLPGAQAIPVDLHGWKAAVGRGEVNAGHDAGQFGRELAGGHERSWSHRPSLAQR